MARLLPRTLARRFARRMAPAALLGALCLALLPPLAHMGVSWLHLSTQASIYARHIGAALRASAEARPRLWRYDLPKLLRSTAGHRGQVDIGRLEIHDCAGRLVFDAADLHMGTGRSGGPSGSVPVLAQGRALATVRVSMDPVAPLTRALRLALVSTVLALLLGLALYRYPVRVVERQAERLEQTHDALEAARLELEGINRSLAEQVEAAVAQVRALSVGVLQAQEHERVRLARELHDGLGQSLTGLGLRLALLARDAPGGAQAEGLAGAAQLVEGALVELRSVVRALRPAELERLGTLGALRALVEVFEADTGTPAALRISGSLDGLPEPIALALYRTLQEGLHNIRRHAAAAEVGARVRRSEAELELQVEDDGVGFVPGDASQGSLGLKGLAERAQLLGGELQVRSGPTAGTCLTLRLPLVPPVVAGPSPRSA